MVWYSAILDTIVEMVNGPHKCLVEALALAILEELFRRFGSIDEVRITIHKPEAPLRERVADVGISLARRRAVQG